MPDDFATLYISEDLEPEFKINKESILNEVANCISSKGIKVKTNQFIGKDGYNHKEIYFDSYVNRDIRWRVILRIERPVKTKLFISLKPEFRGSGKLNYLNGSDVRNLASTDIDSIKTQIGVHFEINVEGSSIKFEAFAYGKEDKIDISKWEVNFSETTIDYEKYGTNVNKILNKLKQMKPFNFRVIDLTSNGSNKNKIAQIISELEKYGNKSSTQYGQPDYKDIAKLPKDIKTVNLILIDDKDTNAYKSSKAFFLPQNLPFQHIIVNGQFTSNSYAKNMAIMEIYKKSYTHDLYLIPDHFKNEKLAGFIYLDAHRLDLSAGGQGKNIFFVSYIMSMNVDYLDEFVSFTEGIDVSSERFHMNISDVDKASEYIIKSDTLQKNNKSNPFYYNIVLTKELNKKNMNGLINALKDRGMNINRVYYVSNSNLGFVDNFLYKKGNDIEIPYKIIGSNIAVIKVATKAQLFPQLFSTFVKLLYPENEDITKADIKNIVWLSKKRLYRIHSVNHMTRIEPVVIKQNNIEFLDSPIGDVNLNYLI